MSKRTQQFIYKVISSLFTLQEKGNQMMDSAANIAQSAKESLQEAGQQVQAKAQGAADAVKNATGLNK
ncbi:hypothetical protein EJD97_014694 [Solanum chilense]|uniref:Pollen coat protein n=1 Tax=Solanum chilense TaxID=4083 RepID=A0A6N2AI83_SOLCI|nr:hypothetical protein EJD97_014694 [Solanum chilense]